ncbi:MAG: hypothetical protein F4X84_07330 [Synechococcus sp. SB0662_bin_45]|uniref:DUF7680 domain-containing protein n=1 Tax=Synechococcus sp. SB0676_bin_10 TaxID=2604869 RepID=A0A6B1FDT6_9SYNE|nr:hypothetical protein [Cyanobacteria bacterium MAG IRC1_bin_28]MDE0648517.1 hypothetical protein [Cyanobacteria bacterium MAG IRC4_bin_6]MXW11416.1 hypothetical protein [Synechococcus sp. SB0668_bin_13]MXY18819.1 hypothetical protein [Synechococcus sp. SB0664_bin_36]MXY61916.1 hypothetical protein [Synechococcus sp. SB0665_bin_28]MYE22143.1 hypothetical protein [Synechococcus sp. SB0662_bin_45]MYF20326.1 hypothetical protein [Synechococcus sp. SB0677_bin_5]MYF35369.1 hypothetical protein [
MSSAVASGRPAYELRSRQRGPSDLLLEVWQVPSTATPELRRPRRIAGLGGHKLLLVEGAVLRRLNTEKVSLARLRKGESRRDRLSEELALAMGLLFKLLAPMRNVTAMDNCARGIDAMAREEAAYWLGMAMHRKKPRRVLAALRLLLSAN